MRRLSRSRADRVRTRSDPRSGRGGRGTHVDGHEEEAALVGRVSGPDDGGVPVEDVIVRPRTRAARGGGILLEILRCGSSWMGDVGTVSVRREARARSGRVGGARLRAGAPSGIFLGVLPSSSARGKKLGWLEETLRARRNRRGGDVRSGAHLQLLGDSLRRHREPTLAV